MMEPIGSGLGALLYGALHVQLNSLYGLRGSSAAGAQCR